MVDGDTVDLRSLGRARLRRRHPEVYGGAECFGPEAYTKRRLPGGTSVAYELALGLALLGWNDRRLERRHTPHR